MRNQQRWPLLVALAATAAMLGSPGHSQSLDQQIYEIGTKKQLFADGRWLAEHRGVELRVNRPVLTHERCIVATKPWESHRVGAYNSVLQIGDELRMYYDAIASDGSRWLCLAISHDGIHWEKPELGVVAFDGESRTNIVFPPAKSKFEPGCVFLDENPHCPESERFKLVCTYAPPGTERVATYVAVSGDGIHFRLLSDKPVFRSSDTGNVCFYDPRIRKYVGYVRVWDRWRKVGRVETDDITRWGQAGVVFSYDIADQRGLDPELFTGMDFYNSAAIRLPDADDIYLMFPTAYYHYRPETAKEHGRPYVRAGNDGPMDVQFAISRDGVHWTRLDRRPFIKIGDTDWDRGYAYVATGLVVRDKEIWLYYATAPYTHGDYSVQEDRYTGTITRAVLRRDGFVSVEAGPQGGEFVTPLLKFEGSRLILNVRTGAGGHVRVGVLDAAGAAYPGLAAADCLPINGNHFATEARWRGGNLSALSDKPVRLRFVLRDASLYSFQFGPEQGRHETSQAAQPQPR